MTLRTQFTDALKTSMKAGDPGAHVHAADDPGAG